MNDKGNVSTRLTVLLELNLSWTNSLAPGDVITALRGVPGLPGRGRPAVNVSRDAPVFLILQFCSNCQAKILRCWRVRFCKHTVSFATHRKLDARETFSMRGDGAHSTQFEPRRQLLTFASRRICLHFHSASFGLEPPFQLRSFHLAHSGKDTKIEKCLWEGTLVTSPKLRVSTA